MLEFRGADILSVDQFDRDDVERVFDVADCMVPYARRERVTRVLEGAVLGSMFFEPSTRTRVSFGAAFNLLGGNVRETTEIKASSLAKGESLADTARVLSGYSDIIVLRHQLEGSVAEFAASSRVPVINGGDGSNEHPTQALLDLYTIRREMRARGRGIDNLRIAMVGDLRYGRAVRSLCKVIGLFDNISLSLISPPELAGPVEITADLAHRGHRVTETNRLEEGIQNVDIIYVTRTQAERFASPEEAARYRVLFQLTRKIYANNCQPDTVIMHPLPRDQVAGELSPELDTNPNLAIFRQTDNGVLVRMALFAMILDVVDQVDAHSRGVPWHSRSNPAS